MPEDYPNQSVELAAALVDDPGPAMPPILAAMRERGDTAQAAYQRLDDRPPVEPLTPPAVPVGLRERLAAWRRKRLPEVVLDPPGRVWRDATDEVSA